MVRPSDLANSYHDNRMYASAAYNNVVIVSPVQKYQIEKTKIHWFLIVGKNDHPSIVFEFEKEPKAEGAIWIEGKVVGCIDDKKERQLPGFDFYIRVTDCRIVQRPTSR